VTEAAGSMRSTIGVTTCALAIGALAAPVQVEQHLQLGRAAKSQCASAMQTG